MPIKPEQLAALMQEVEQEDPIDFADLPFPEDELRALVATHLCEMAASMEKFSTEDRLMTLLAVSAKLVLENLVLHVQLLRRHGLPVSDNVEALLSRLRKGGEPVGGYASVGMNACLLNCHGKSATLIAIESLLSNLFGYYCR